MSTSIHGDAVTGRRVRRPVAKAVAALMALALVAAACSSDDNSSSSTDNAAPADETAILHPSGINATAGGVPSEGVGAFDVTKSRTRTNYDYQRLVYDGLLRRDGAGNLQPGFAKSADLTDPTTIKIELYPGITFSDGAPLDAEAVKFGLQRNITAKNTQGMRVEIFDITSMDVTDPTHLTLHLGKAVGGAVLFALAGMEGVLVSPKAVAAGTDLDKNPVGAGPFILQEYVPNTSFKLKKNPTYFQADQIKVAGYDMFAAGPDPTATANGLRTGQIDFTSILPQAQVDGLQGTPGLEFNTVLDPNGTYATVWCMSNPPLSDVRVRQALALATDREAINRTVFANKGEVAWGLYNKDNPLYDPDQEGVNAYDPTAAKKLLAEAGYPNGFSTGTIVFAGEPTRVAEVLQQQWAQVGVQLTLQTTTNSLTDFYTNPKQPMNTLADTSDNLQRQYGQPNSVANVCKFADPKFVDPLNALVQYPFDSPEYTEQMHVVDGLVNSMMIKLAYVFPPATAVSNTNLGGVEMTLSTLGRPVIDLFKVYKKAGS